MSILPSRAGSSGGTSPSLFVKTSPLSSDLDVMDKASISYLMLNFLQASHRLAALTLTWNTTRSNMGLARVTGMGDDLDLDVGARYSIASCVYFIPYILLELPSNMCLRVVGVRNLLTGTVLAWGAVQLGMGFVPTWGYLVLCRTLLGVFEASGVFSGVGIHRDDLVSAATTFGPLQSVFTSILGGFSNILAYALSLLDGKGGLGGWCWIFIIEGAATMIFGIISWTFIPDFPDRNTFLTTEQTALVLRRVEEDRGDALPDSMRGKVFLHLSDWKVWIFVPAYALGPIADAAFAQILRELDFGWDGMGFADVSIACNTLLGPGYNSSEFVLPEQDVFCSLSGSPALPPTVAHFLILAGLIPALPLTV
ncbi:major facilitator superfamily domain-containing protein [Armillaria luteobubalina]|uniref:Major facilitator superfamily domain-containing protein n=1 Tax=Armillaria luteobubalina TaxID=153913 RepID=A0AA39Q085_9AGAR|nr:major facilitator superfamily domain-containing protein [Armillaria luteobubalina]